MKQGLEIKDCQCLDTHLNFIRDFTGERTKISVKRSTLLAMASAGDIVGNFELDIVVENVEATLTIGTVDNPNGAMKRNY